MDAAQWPQQGIGVAKEVESTQRQQLQAEKRVRPYKEQALNCPRCNSTNTKFCYYNNYSLSQPRYFCKTCRRYWTEGGSLRNVPVGGGSRKNKRPSSTSSSSSFPSSSSPSSSTTASLPASSSLNLHPSDQLIPTPPIPLPSSKFYNHGGQDLNLSFSNQSLAQYELGAASGGSISALELLRSGISARGFCLSPESGSAFGAGFGFQELMRQSDVKLPFGHHGGYSGSMQQVQEGGTGRLLFPFEDLRQVQMSNGGQAVEQNEAVQEGDPSMFWNGGSGAGGTWS